jgi:hypothetical protein
MNAHFGNPLADRLTVPEVAMLGRADAKSYARTTCLVLEGRKPGIKFIGALKGIHTTQCIHADTRKQSRRNRQVGSCIREPLE